MYNYFIKHLGISPLILHLIWARNWLWWR